MKYELQKKLRMKYDLGPPIPTLIHKEMDTNCLVWLRAAKGPWSLGIKINVPNVIVDIFLVVFLKKTSRPYS